MRTAATEGPYMASNTRRLIAVGIAATLAFTSLTTAAQAAEAHKPVTTNSAKAAAGWLAQRLLDANESRSVKGDHLDFPPFAPGDKTYYWGGLSASAVYAFAAAKVGTNATARILDYMRANAASDAGMGFGDMPGAYDGSVATYALTAEITRNDPRDFGGSNLLATLKADECTTVSMPTDASDFTTPLCTAVGSARNIYSSISESLVILAEARAADTAYAPSDAAVAYFLSLQCPNGGFTGTDTSACTDAANASPDETAYAVMALQSLGNRTSAVTTARAAAVKWLKTTRSSKGYWIAQKTPNVDTTGLAVAALDGVWGSGATNQAWLQKSRTWLRGQRVTKGQTVGTAAARGALQYPYGKPFDALSSEKATADGILGLVRGGSLATLVTSKTAASGVPVLAPAVTVLKPKVSVGKKQTLTAKGFTAAERVTAVVHSAKKNLKLTAKKAKSSGVVTFKFTVPASLGSGKHTVVLKGTTSGLVGKVTFTVKKRS